MHHLPEFNDILRTQRIEGGFVGQKSFKENPMGSARKVFNEMNEECEEIGKRVLSIQEDMDLDKEETTR